MAAKTFEKDGIEFKLTVDDTGYGLSKLIDGKYVEYMHFKGYEDADDCFEYWIDMFLENDK